MKVYIAAPYPLRDEAIDFMRRLEIRGFTVTSRWLRVISEMSDEEARNDLRDVARAEMMIMLHPDGWHNKGTGGRHVEMGYALALGIRVVLIGERTNNFHHLKQIRVYKSENEFLREVDNAIGALS